jgi:hypothetical protein
MAPLGRPQPRSRGRARQAAGGGHQARQRRDAPLPRHRDQLREVGHDTFVRRTVVVLGLMLAVGVSAGCWWWNDGYLQSRTMRQAQLVIKNETSGTVDILGLVSEPSVGTLSFGMTLGRLRRPDPWRLGFRGECTRGWLTAPSLCTVFAAASSPGKCPGRSSVERSPALSSI